MPDLTNCSLFVQDLNTLRSYKTKEKLLKGLPEFDQLSWSWLFNDFNT